MRKSLFILFISLLGTVANAQDKIFLQNSEIIECEIIEIGTDRITYLKWNNRTGPDYIIEKSSVKYIVFKNGTTENITSSPDSTVVVKAAPHFHKNKNLIGINYFDIVYLNINLFYERFFIKHDFSLKINLSPGFGRENRSITFLGFSDDYFHGMFSVNYYPMGFNRISYYTGLDLVTGVGRERYYYGYYSPYGYYSEDRTFIYYAFHVLNGVHFSLSKHFDMKTCFSLGLVDRNQNGNFDIHAMFELSAGFRF